MRLGFRWGIRFGQNRLDIKRFGIRIGQIQRFHTVEKLKILVRKIGLGLFENISIDDLDI